MLLETYWEPGELIGNIISTYSFGAWLEQLGNHMEHIRNINFQKIPGLTTPTTKRGEKINQGS
jgi:hypothetical protein